MWHAFQKYRCCNQTLQLGQTRENHGKGPWGMIAPNSCTACIWKVLLPTRIFFTFIP